MNIEYHNKTVKKQCIEFKTAKKYFGDKIAEKLHSTINIIERATNLRDISAMPTFHFHPLLGNSKNSSKKYAIDIGGRKSGYRLIMVPLDDNRNEVKDNGKGSLYDCTTVLLILEVSNHYE